LEVISRWRGLALGPDECHDIVTCDSPVFVTIGGKLKHSIGLSDADRMTSVSSLQLRVTMIKSNDDPRFRLAVYQHFSGDGVLRQPVSPRATPDKNGH
jgi:hypothetical protein